MRNRFLWIQISRYFPLIAILAGRLYSRLILFRAWWRAQRRYPRRRWADVRTPRTFRMIG